MKFFENIKKKIILKKISKLKNNRHTKFHYLNEPKKIGFIVNAENNISYHYAENFADLLISKKNEVHKLFFVNKKIGKKEEKQEHKFNLYRNEWKKSDFLKSFLEKDFNIIFIFNFFENYKLHYIIAQLKAEMIVSPKYEEHNFADFTFIIENDNPQKREIYVESIKKYLTECKNKTKNQHNNE